jgi:type VI protein secretion system component VasK
MKTNGRTTSALSWQSIREKLTVYLAIGIIVVALAVVVFILTYSVYQNNPTLTDKVLTIFSAITMAVLGYLFGYVPTKASEESMKKDRDATEKRIKSLKKAVNEFRTLLADKDKTIKDYEDIMNLLEEE